MKRIISIFVIFCSITFFSSLEAANDNSKKMIVVIDAGHGGHDPGAAGKFSKEKDIALKIALKLGNYIENYFNDVKVIYTRKTDVFIELHKRAQIANKNEADVFISIHCNANRSSKPRGADTWVMGLHKSKANLDVAKLENKSILMEDDYELQYDGFDPNSAEAYIIFSLFQNSNLEQSLTLASNVQGQFRERAGRVDRGVKQAGFLVLYRTTMPGILIETGFISNPEEEKYLASDDGQSYLASAIFRAFRTYKNDIQGKEQISEDIIPGKADEEKEEVNISGVTDISFKIQVKTSPEKLELDTAIFSKLKEVAEYEHYGLFKYTAGKFSLYEEAVNYKLYLRGNGFPDAFIVAFNGNKRIDLDEAKKLSGQ